MAFLKRISLSLIKLYRMTLSPMIGMHCRFTPTCSAYALTAIDRHGVGQGTWLTLKRLSKCHPWHPGGEDRVPEIKP